MKRPPERIETARLLLRCFEEADAPLFAEQLESSREHYDEFIPFFLEGDALDRVRGYRAAFAADEHFVYAALAGGRLVGGCMLFPRVGPGGLELGYNVRADEVGRGYATEMTGALIEVAFDVCGVDRVEAHIDPANAASIAVAQRLGLRREATLRRRIHVDGREPRDLAIYTLFRADYAPATRSVVRSASDGSVRSASASDAASGG